MVHARNNCATDFSIQASQAIKQKTSKLRCKFKVLLMNLVTCRQSLLPKVNSFSKLDPCLFFHQLICNVYSRNTQVLFTKCAKQSGSETVNTLTHCYNKTCWALLQIQTRLHISNSLLANCKIKTHLRKKQTKNKLQNISPFHFFPTR